MWRVCSLFQFPSRARGMQGGDRPDVCLSESPGWSFVERSQLRGDRRTAPRAHAHTLTCHTAPHMHVDEEEPSKLRF